jgi:hypothetical protein
MKEVSFPFFSLLVEELLPFFSSLLVEELLPFFSSPLVGELLSFLFFLSPGGRGLR